MYADHKKFDLGRISVEGGHSKTHVEDCEGSAAGKKHEVSRFDRVIFIEGYQDDETKKRLLNIADHCPVHRTLRESSTITTAFHDPGKKA